MENNRLLALAKEAMEYAYAPYSGFRVGAALLCRDGTVYTGCNVENISYGAANCAERTAIFKAVSYGNRAFEKIAIVSSSDEMTYPCGICRQVLREFGTDITIVLESKTEIIEYKLEELLPYSFQMMKE